jgi:hypothetical protein
MANYYLDLGLVEGRAAKGLLILAMWAGFIYMLLFGSAERTLRGDNEVPETRKHAMACDATERRAPMQMQSPWTKALALQEVFWLGFCWMVMFTAPTTATSLKFGVTGWLLIAAAAGYCGYTGIKALQRGQKGKIITRLVIPVTLLILGFVIGPAIFRA